MATGPQREDAFEQLELLPIGSEYGPYKILSCLGFSILGSLYQAIHRESNEEFCLWVFPKKAWDNVNFANDIGTYFEKLKGFDHPNILKLLSMDEIDRRFCFVFESIDGDNLNHRLEQKLEAILGTGDDINPDDIIGLPEEEVKDYLSQTASALGYAHDQQIYHLSITPTNLLLDKSGTIKVVGFGFMQMMGKELFERIVSAAIVPVLSGVRRFRINTVDVLSPAMRRGQEFDRRGDFFGLGITGYWLLTGRKLQQDSPMPSQIIEGISPGWDSILGTCAHTDPEQTYQHPSELKEDLQNLQPASAEVGEGAAPKTPRVRRRRALDREQTFFEKPIGKISAVLAALVLLVGIIFGVSGLFMGEQEIAIAQNGEESFTFMVTPPTATVNFPDKNKSFKVTNGKLKLLVPEEEVLVEIQSPNHYEVRKRLNLAPGGIEKVTLDSYFGVIEATALPETKITAKAEGKEPIVLGMTDPNGKLRADDKLLSGEYMLTFEKDDYDSFTLTRVSVLQGEVTTVAAEQIPMLGQITVTTSPIGATVSINGEPKGETPVTVDGLPVGEELLVTVNLMGHYPLEKSIVLDPNDDELMEFGTLSAQMGTIAPRFTAGGKPLTADQMADLTLKLDGNLVANLSSPLEGVLTGEHTLVASLPHYRDATAKVKVEKEKVTSVTLDLAPMSARLSVQTTPEKPFRLVSNRRVMKPEKDGSYTLDADKSYNLEVHARNYLIVRRDLELGPDEEDTWLVKLMPIPGPQIDKGYTVPYVGVQMNYVPAGTFKMGSPPRESARLPQEGPQSEVTFTYGFWVGRHEVTQMQYQAVMGKNPSRFKAASSPVESVDWFEAMAFANRITQQERKAGRLPQGYVYRLPTEFEWEYFARAGSENPFSFDLPATPLKGNFRTVYPRTFTSDPDAPENQRYDEKYGPIAVGSYSENPWGLYDIHGNVREWCANWYTGRLPGGRQKNPIGPTSGTMRAVRGGGWESEAKQTRAAFRNGALPETDSISLGFRLVLAPEIDLFIEEDK